MDDVLVQTRIDPAIKDRAAEVLERMGLTVADAMRLLLTRTANEGALPFAATTSADPHDAWFRAQVQAALDDPTPDQPHDAVEAYFAGRRAAVLAKHPD
jgi:DNA-damage-inducible protein J